MTLPLCCLLTQHSTAQRSTAQQCAGSCESSGTCKTLQEDMYDKMGMHTRANLAAAYCAELQRSPGLQRQPQMRLQPRLGVPS